MNLVIFVMPYWHNSTDSAVRYRASTRRIFGQMKYDVRYKHFLHFGKDKITKDFNRLNIKKIAYK